MVAFNFNVLELVYNFGLGLHVPPSAGVTENPFASAVTASKTHWIEKNCNCISPKYDRRRFATRRVVQPPRRAVAAMIFKMQFSHVLSSWQWSASRGPNKFTGVCQADRFRTDSMIGQGQYGCGFEVQRPRRLISAVWRANLELNESSWRRVLKGSWARDRTD